MIHIYNCIKQNYGLIDFTILKKDDYYVINCNELSYYLYFVNDSNTIMRKYYITNDFDFFYRFVPNAYNSIVSYFYNKKFVLLFDNKKKYPLFKNILFTSNYRISWFNEWLENSKLFYDKIIRYNNSDLFYFLDYYSCLIDFSICNIKTYMNYVYNGYISHDFFDIKELSNPLYITIDIKERELADYLKYIFFNNEYKNMNLNFLLDSSFSLYDFNIVLIRLIYPDYIVEKVLKEGSLDILSLNVYYNRIIEFEEYVINLYTIISNRYEVINVYLLF